MKYYEIPQGSILIAPAYLHPMIQKSWIDHHHGMFQIYLKTLSAFFHADSPYSHHELLWKFYEIIKPIQNQLSVLKNIALSSAFLEELYQFMVKQEQYVLSLENLPVSTSVQKELALLIHAINDQHFVFDGTNTILNTLTTQQSDLHHVYILDAYYTIFEQTQIEALTTLGAKIIPWEMKQPDIHFYHAINKRQELASVAEEIIKHYHAEDVQITLCDTSYKPFVEQVFQEYQIPYTILNNHSITTSHTLWIELLSYIQKPNRERLFPLLDSNLFHIPYLHDLSTYLQLFEKDLNDDLHHLENVSISDDILSYYELSDLKEMEQHANEAKDTLLPLLTPLWKEDLLEAIKYAFSLLAQNHMHQKTLSQIQTLLQESILYLHDRSDLTFLIELCENMSETTTNDVFKGVLVTDLKKPLLPNKVQFLLGCDQKHYPAFQSEQGFFDEDYLQSLHYIPLKKRYQHMQEQLNKHLQSSDILYLFYAQGDFHGKSNEAAIEMETLAKQRSTLYPFTQIDEMEVTQPALSPDTAKALFVKDGAVHGSISAFERYLHCPFSYFLRYGLGIKEPLDVTFNVAKIGTLSHYVMEKLCSDYQKAYVEHADQILPLMEEKIKEIILVYPNQEALLQNILERLYHALTILFEQLSDMEKATAFTPSKLEHRFVETIETSSDIQVKINGIIDRIDFYAHFLRIIDYKSSTKVLALPDILAGKQLQLLTYAYVAKKQFELDVAGAYYQSMKNETINLPAGKLKRRPVAYESVDTVYGFAEKRKKSGLKGWTMTEFYEALDQDGTHINGFSKNKDGNVTCRTIYNMDAIEELLKQLYGEITKKLLSGDISCTPDKDACTFCKYHDICRFKGIFRDTTPLVNEPENLYLKGGKKHEME